MDTDALLRKGYLPENLPPFFYTDEVADYFRRNPPRDYLTKHDRWVFGTTYSASKRGLTRRNFTFIHPIMAYDLARFLSTHNVALEAHLAQSTFTLSKPRAGVGERALEISSHGEVDDARLQKLAEYRFIVKTDISRFYHSIYTHSIPWAVHGKANSKSDKRSNSSAIFCNRLDQIIRCGQDGQTIGIPVGPDASRVISELVAVAIDRAFVAHCALSDYAVVRHVDDVWIGTRTHADAEQALWSYREAIRSFELDINESKTEIRSENARFVDVWPIDLQKMLEQAPFSSAQARRERLRAALEYAFGLCVASSDDGILKYTLRQIDKLGLARTNWEIVEPFLKRVFVHFGHTASYVIRILVWRALAMGSIDISRWTPILVSSLYRHARLGNDSEVCWILYACLQLRIKVDRPACEAIIGNCNALSVLAILGCAARKLTDGPIFQIAMAALRAETGNGKYWPVLLHWASAKWPQYRTIRAQLGDDVLLAMATRSVRLFAPDRLQKVFVGLDSDEFDSAQAAIEASDSYDEDEGVDDLFIDPDVDDFL